MKSLIYSTATPGVRGNLYLLCFGIPHSELAYLDLVVQIPEQLQVSFDTTLGGGLGGYGDLGDLGE